MTRKLCSAVLCALSALIFAAGDATAQSTLGSPEQNIWTAPIGGAAPEIGGGAVVASGGFDPCASATTAEVVAVCAEAALSLIVAQSELAEREAAVVLEAREATLRFEEARRAHALAALADQSWRSAVIFWLALAMIALGALAALLQFRKAWAADVLDGAGTEISISEKQVTIKTAWIGVVLLALSMGFFALYLALVFRIEAI
ncbi:MAG: hypothetical protein AAFN79_02590 [Pseudomonadota bacterium]